MKLILFIFIIISVGACKKDNDYYLNKSTLKILGHSGMGDHYLHPMNSLASLYTILQIGADGTECDVPLTKDNTIVLFHDETLDKLTNYKGFVSSKSWSELNTCHYSWINSTKLKVITLQEFIDKIDKNNFTISLDVKLWRDENQPYNNLARRFAQAINDFATKKIFVREFNGRVPRYNPIE